MNTDVIDIKTLSIFILKARKRYFTNAQLYIVKQNQEAYETDFREGTMFYQRSYMGTYSLIGKEIVSMSDRPVWGLSFFGATLGEKISKEDIHYLLNAMLMLSVPVDENYKLSSLNKEYTFENLLPNGDITNFKGEKFAIQKNMKLFNLQYFGGLIIGDHRE